MSNVLTHFLYGLWKLLTTKESGMVKFVPTEDPHQLLLMEAEKEIGVKTTSPNRGPRVDQFEEAIIHTVGESWCMCFVQAMIQEVEKDWHIHSPLFVSGSCREVWEHDVALQRKNPDVGSLMIWNIPNPDGTRGLHGHVGVVSALNPDGTISTIEGNSHHAGANPDDPREVCRKIRSRDGSPTFTLLGWLDPFPLV